MSMSRAFFAACTAALLSLAPSSQEANRGDVQMLIGDGTNPICLEGQAPTLDSMWLGKVDASGIPGAQAAMLMLSGAPWATGSIETEAGQLLVDPAMAIYRLNRPLNGSRVQFGIPVPDDPALIGERFYVQAMAYGFRAMQLCNALEVTIGDRIVPNRDRD